MAKHKNLKSFGRTIIKRGKEVELNVVKGIRQAVLIMDQVLVVLTPVDTGYARSRWQVTIGEPAQAETGVSEIIKLEEELATAISLSQAKESIAKWNGKGSIYITNTVNYTIYLDQGSSTQAPNGMTDEAIKAGTDFLKQLKILS